MMGRDVGKGIAMNGNLARREEFREERINGVMVAMSPAASNHNRIAGNIGSSVPAIRRWSSTFCRKDSLYCTRFIPFIRVGCWRRCPGRSGLQSRQVSNAACMMIWISRWKIYFIVQHDCLPPQKVVFYRIMNFCLLYHMGRENSI